MSRPSQLCALLTALVALSASQTTLAQTCADLIFADEVTDALPEASAACLDVVQRDGRTYARFKAEITRVNGPEVRARFALPDGGYTDVYGFEPDRERRVQIDGREYMYSQLNAGQELDIYVPSDRWELDIPDQPDFLVAQITVVTPYRPAPDNTVAALPRTASPLPLIGLLGVLFMGLWAGLALVRHRLS